MTQRTIPPLTFITHGGTPDADTEGVIAATLAWMTAHAFDAEPEEEPAAVVAENLLRLSRTSGLSEDFRRLCGRLHEVWSRAAGTDATSRPR